MPNSEASAAPVRRAAVPLSLIPLHDLPLFTAGMNVAQELASASDRQGLRLRNGDVVVVAQKVVSKAEGRIARLGDVAPSAAALDLAARTGRSAALMHLVLAESAEIVRATPAVVIARHSSGHVCANAGIDASNVQGDDEVVLLWPKDPDASADALRRELAALTGAVVGVVVADSLGRAWRMGTQGAAIGASGVVVVDDRRGEQDLFGRTLQATLVGVADSLAAAAVLVMGEGAEGAPAVIVRGAEGYVRADAPSGAAGGLRPLDADLFR